MYPIVERMIFNFSLSAKDKKCHLKQEESKSITELIKFFIIFLSKD